MILCSSAGFENNTKNNNFLAAAATGVVLFVSQKPKLQKHYARNIATPGGYRYPAGSNFPELRGHNNAMADVLKEDPGVKLLYMLARLLRKSLLVMLNKTLQIYSMYHGIHTPNGFSFDQVIQTGVDNPGHPFIQTVGCVAGDEETYDVSHAFRF